MKTTQRFLVLLAAFLLFAWSAMAGVNINTASQSQLETLPGIGPAKAAAIIAFRGDNGPFTAIDQLDNVPGIGPATMDNLRPLVELGDGSVAPADTQPDDGAPAAPSANAVNVNTAGASQLQSLPGIGPSKATAIVADRDANGPFSSCDDLQRVRGIGAATVASLRGVCVTE